VDLVAEPERADEHRILATPTLVRRRPTPVRKIIGDLSDTDRVMAGLEIDRTST
jgi:circadian clock protein KaiB